MSSKIAAASISLLLAAGSIIPTPAAASGLTMASTVQAATDTQVSVPLPVSRPDRRARLAFADADDPATGPATGVARSDVAPAPDGSSLKSGSTEAMSVQFEGAKVVSAEGVVVGEVERVVEEPGVEPHVVVALGGFLGIGENRVRLPVSALAPSAQGMARTEMTQSELRGLPAASTK